jgi:alpha-L-fucosidase
MGDPDIRWGGNEMGFGAPDLWTVVDATRADVYWGDDVEALAGEGCYLPAEMDTPINAAGWFWHPDAARHIRSLDELLGVYYRSVGHGANLLLNLAPNRAGRLEEAEVERLCALGDAIERRFGRPVASATDGTGVLEIALPAPTVIARFEAMEDLRNGEHVQEWVLEADMGQTRAGQPAWHRLAAGNTLGHKRLGDIAPIRTRRVRLRVLRERGPAGLRSLRLFAPEAIDVARTTDGSGHS